MTAKCVLIRPGANNFARRTDLQDKFVVMYSGNHSPVHPLDTLMQAAEFLKDDGSMAFCFIGGGSEFKRVKQWAEKGKRSQCSMPAVSAVEPACRLTFCG